MIYADFLAGAPVDGNAPESSRNKPFWNGRGRGLIRKRSANSIGRFSNLIAGESRKTLSSVRPDAVHLTRPFFSVSDQRGQSADECIPAYLMNSLSPGIHRNACQGFLASFRNSFGGPTGPRWVGSCRMTIDLFSRTASEKAMNQSNATKEFVRLRHGAGCQRVLVGFVSQTEPCGHHSAGQALNCAISLSS